jgi:MFS family permease
VFNHLKLKLSPTHMADSIGVNRVVLTLSIARLADALGNSILFIIIPLYVAQLPSPWFPLPDSVRVGLLISLYGLVTSVFQPVMGALSDRLSRRKPFIQSGLALMGIGTLAFSFAGQFSQLLLLRALQGIGVALTIPASMALMASATTKQTRGGSMGVYSSMRMVGFAAGPLIGGVLQLHFGFNATFYAGTALLLIAMILVQMWVRDVPVEVPTEAPGPFRIIDRELLAGGIIGLGVAMFLMASAFSMMGALENEFNARLQQTVLGFSIAFSALTFSRLLVQIPLGRLSDRVGRKPLILLGLLLMAPATALLGEAGTIVQLTGLRVFQGIASGAIAAPAFALAADLARSGGEGRQMSILTMGFGLGIALGPLIAGVLAVVFFELPFLLGGLMSLIGVWVVYRYVPETVQRRGAPAVAWARAEVCAGQHRKGQRD